MSDWLVFFYDGGGGKFGMYVIMWWYWPFQLGVGVFPWSGTLQDRVVRVGKKF